MYFQNCKVSIMISCEIKIVRPILYGAPCKTSRVFIDTKYKPLRCPKKVFRALRP